MGIPSFYRWLVEKYPLAVADVIEEPPYSTINGVQIPLDTTKPNPNGIEFDNLYLDMNGIIHPCFHPEGQPPPKSYEDVFKAVFKYIDRIFSIIRPRKLLYMAIDGVAPRAKMNQQRARRFKSAKEAADAAAKEEIRRNVFEAEGEKLHSMDSNIITPGSEFMACLSNALQYYIQLRMNTDLGWHGVKVILSDANVVGEGEHKIMSYIRLQRNRPGYDPNTRHCLYGLDADLIMLALASHEIHFSILREDVTKVHQNMGNSRRGKFSMRRGNQDLLKGEIVNTEVHDYISRQKFQFFNVWILREYLAHEMNIPNLTAEADLERLLDDFVFMCLFVGNDFLPHVPSLEISEGAIDLLMTMYKKEFVQMGGYLTDSFKVNLKRIEHFMQAVGRHENAIFRRRSQVQKNRYTHHANSKAKQGSTEARQLLRPKQNSQTFWSTVDLISKSTDQLSPSSGAKESKGSLTNGTTDGTSETVYNSDAKRLKSAPTMAMGNGASETVDNIKLGEEGWKGRFYVEKFKAKTEDECDCIRKHAVLKYIEGMCWVMHYYYEGVCSWQWFYPYHYAPFASDFYDLEHLQIHFMLGQPFKPFDQLMGVLPPASAHALPLSYRGLMLDPSSPILDLYPTDFELDMNGKRHEWQAICKLPFIEESRLLTEIAKVAHTLTDEEKRRNSLGMDMLFVHISHPLEGHIITCFERSKGHSKLAEAKAKCTIDPKISDGMNGFMYISDRPVSPREINSPVGDMEKITMNKVLTVFYGYPDRQPHIPRPPKGVVMPRMSVGKEDAPAVPMLWHEKSGVLGRVHYERPIAKSISGSCLVKLAHRLVLEYCADKRKENLDPSVFERLVARFVPSRPTKPMRKPVKKKPRKENDVAGTVSGNRKRKARPGVKGRLIAVRKGRQDNETSCPTQSNSIETTKPVKRENNTASTTPGREKCKSGAAGKERQGNEVPSVHGHSALNDPFCPTQSNPIETTKPEQRDYITAATTSGREKCERKDAKSAVLDGHSTIDADGCVDAGKPIEKELEKENDVAGTISGKRKRKPHPGVKARLRAKRRQGNEVPLVPGHGALSDPLCPTQSNSMEATEPEKRDNSTIDAPLYPTLSDSMVVHEENMVAGGCMDVGKPGEKVAEKENDIGGPISGKRKRGGRAAAKRRRKGKQDNEVLLVLGHSALNEPSFPTQSNSIEMTQPEKRDYSTVATSSGREQCQSGDAEHVKSADLDGHSNLDAPLYPTRPDSVLGHEKKMDAEGCVDVGRSVEKENDSGCILIKSKLGSGASSGDKDVPSFQTQSNSIEAVRDKYMDGKICLIAVQPDDPGQSILGPETDHC